MKRRASGLHPERPGLLLIKSALFGFLKRRGGYRPSALTSKPVNSTLNQRIPDEHAVMKKFIFGFIAALVLIVAGVFGCVYLGLVPVATSSPPLPFEKLITHMALNARVDKEAPKASSIPASNGVYLAGAHIYRNDCAVCHGLPGQDQTAIARGEFPKPPNLFKGKGVTDDPAGETYWKVANGIRLTGMPGFKGSLSPEQMWQVSLLLAGADKLPAAVRTVLQQPLP